MELLKNQIETTLQELMLALNQASSLESLEQVRIEHLGRNGTITHLMQSLKTLSVDEKKIFGPLLNQLKITAEGLYQEKLSALQRALDRAQQELHKDFDVTAYRPANVGSLHLYTHLVQELEDIFISMGYAIADGPEVETDYYNFSALNIPADHPARDMQDTFWLDHSNLLLRTHTSSVQAHVMEHQKPPIAIFVPGRVYRNEETDASHDFMFMQTEGLFIDKNVSMAHLLATARTFLQKLFGSSMEIRVRPGYFPFVEPGIEIDCSCPFCTSGCSVCKHTRWIELLGAGLVHPNVLKASGIDPEQYSGFAFGMGIDRLAMIRYGINDIRLFRSSKLGFLEQF